MYVRLLVLRWHSTNEIACFVQKNIVTNRSVKNNQSIIENEIIPATLFYSEPIENSIGGHLSGASAHGLFLKS